MSAGYRSLFGFWLGGFGAVPVVVETLPAGPFLIVTSAYIPGAKQQDAYQAGAFEQDAYQSLVTVDGGDA